ncbi:MAG: hypothetical protein ACYTBJ_06955 [Planctomycetota bacterium]|jgi:hypothetical protein
MKESKEYSKKINRLYASLKRKHPKIDRPVYDDPVDAMVYALISERVKESAAQAAVKKFGEYFMDLNDLRVSRVEEIVEVLGQDTGRTREIALALTSALKAVFDKYNLVSLRALKKIGKKQARQILEKMGGLSRFAVNYSLLTSLQGHAMPLTQGMVDHLRSNELVHPEADEHEIGGFLTRQISAGKGYEFYALLRRESESRRARAGKRTTRKTKTKTAVQTGTGAREPRRTRRRKK